MNIDILKSHLLQEKNSHFCFYVKCISESLIVYDELKACAIRNMARDIYTTNYDFHDWERIKINLLSKLRSFYRKRDFLGAVIYYSELMDHVVRILSIHQTGWHARLDVMIDWIKEVIPNYYRNLYLSYRDAINGKPDKLYCVCAEVEASVCKSVSINKSFSISPSDGAKLNL